MRVAKYIFKRNKLYEVKINRVNAGKVNKSFKH